jgi:NADH:ubiquinone oxidoreductase subunit 2 (subunit N)
MMGSFVAPGWLSLWMAFLLPLAALACAALIRRAHSRSGESQAWLDAAIVSLTLLPLAVVVAWPEFLLPARAALAAALSIALLAHDPRDLPQTEVALKIMWVLTAAFALSWTGDALLAMASGSARAREQWPALALALDPYALWSAALSLSLIAGLVLLGGAPFHFWPGDLFHGARAHVAPFVAVTLQLAGAAWLLRHLDGIIAFSEAALLVRSLLTLAATAALVGGAATLGYQSRPERRVGALVSLQGGLVLASLAAAPLREPFDDCGGLALWGGHLLLASIGATLLSRFLPSSAEADERSSVLFRRHPWSGAAGGYALLSLAGAPGTPGMYLWLDVARSLADHRRPGLLFGVTLAWLAAFGVAANEIRRAFGAPDGSPASGRAVPRPLRMALWTVTALGTAVGGVGAVVVSLRRRGANMGRISTPGVPMRQTPSSPACSLAACPPRRCRQAVLVPGLRAGLPPSGGDSRLDYRGHPRSPVSTTRVRGGPSVEPEGDVDQQYPRSDASPRHGVRIERQHAASRHRRAVIPLLRLRPAALAAFRPYFQRDNYAVINKQGVVRYHAGQLPLVRLHPEEILGTVDSLVTHGLDAGGPHVSAWSLAASPNPAHGIITFAVQNPTATPVAARVRVLDLAGRRVVELPGTTAVSGTTRVFWDGRGARGEALPAGVYLVTAELAGRRLVQRVALVN